MELNEALKVVVELAEQNMLNDSEMQLEMLRQMNAIEAVRMHMQELECPSPVLVEIQESVLNNYFRAVTNVPAQVVYVLGDMAPEHVPSTCDPSHTFLDPKDFE